MITLTAEQAMAVVTALEEASKVMLNVATAELQPAPQAEPEKQVYKRWRGDNGDLYYYMDSWGYVDACKDTHHERDNFRYESGNYFQTENQAEAYRKHMLYTQRLRDAAKQAWLDAGTEIDWKGQGKAKHCALWDYAKDDLYIDLRITRRLCNYALFPTEQSCRATYTTILGDDLKWYMTYECGGV